MIRYSRDPRGKMAFTGGARTATLLSEPQRSHADLDQMIVRVLRMLRVYPIAADCLVDRPATWNRSITVAMSAFGRLSAKASSLS